MTLTEYGRREWTAILLGAAGLIGITIFFGWWWVLAIVLGAAVALLSFFRDPNRAVPSDRSVVVSPADGRVSSVHWVDHFEPFGEPALCIRIFLSVFNVHVNRSPCHGKVTSITHTPGQHRNALDPQSAQLNESNLMVLFHPTRNQPVAAVRQIAGAIARRIVCRAGVGQILQRGQRYGMIKFGSTTELYLPKSCQPQAAVVQGQRVAGGVTVLARVSPIAEVPGGAATHNLPATSP